MDHVLRTTASPTQVNDWALVLAAASIQHRVDEHDGHFALVIDEADVGAASQALAGFDEEGAPEQQPPAPDRGWSPLGVLFAAGLAGMFLLSGDCDSGSRWCSTGMAASELIMRGAWWRTITALTLHADLAHLVLNIAGALLFMTAVGRWLGSGLGASLLLVSAVGGNLLTAVRHHAHQHHSLGASTAVFAAIGMVAGLQAARRLQLRTRPGYAWVPIGAGLALFAMLGVGTDAYGGSPPDFYAHLFGLACGVVFGAGWAIMQLRRGWRAPAWPVQVLLGMLTIGVVAGCWLIAFRHPA